MFLYSCVATSKVSFLSIIRVIWLRRIKQRFLFMVYGVERLTTSTCWTALSASHWCTLLVYYYYSLSLSLSTATGCKLPKVNETDGGCREKWINPLDCSVINQTSSFRWSPTCSHVQLDATRRRWQRTKLCSQFSTRSNYSTRKIDFPLEQFEIGLPTK